MDRYDWLGVGLKLLGVYFGVSGVSTLWTVILAMMGAPAFSFVGLLQPAVQLSAAFLLVCHTGLCLRWCGEPEPEELT
jgi:hypothetical protein